MTRTFFPCSRCVKELEQIFRSLKLKPVDLCQRFIVEKGHETGVPRNDQSINRYPFKYRNYTIVYQQQTALRRNTVLQCRYCLFVCLELG